MVKNERLLSEIAQERISRLLELAKERTVKMGRPDILADRYVGIAKSIKSHYRIRSAGYMNKILCKKCNMVLIEGLNAKVRIPSDRNYRAVVCSRCGSEKHIFYR